jgi:hypothetical protein
MNVEAILLSKAYSFNAGQDFLCCPLKCLYARTPMGRKYTHHAVRASLPPRPSPPDDIFENIPVIGINVQLK